MSNDRIYYYDPIVDLPKNMPVAEEEYVSLVDRERVDHPTLANLVSSELEDGRHLPALDIDFEVRLVPSRTEGHYHLYLDGMEPMHWSAYRRLLEALMLAGVIEKGYYGASVERKATFLRVNNIEPSEEF